MVVVIVVVLLGFALSYAALAAPPPGADPNSPQAQWYEGLRQPDSGASCCSIADCRPVQQWRMVGDHYQIWYHNGWLDVPPTKVVHGHDNPTGEAVACVMSLAGNDYVLCFVKGSET